VLSLGALLVAARYFTRSAERLGHMMRMSPLMVGVVIVALGTSLPELVSSIIAASKGNTEIVAGNVLGANISNIFLMLGCVTLVAGTSIFLGEEYIFIDLHFMLGSAVLVSYFMWQGTIGTVEGAILMIGFLIYQIHLFQSEKPKEMPVISEEAEISEIRKSNARNDVLILIASGVGIYFGAEYTVQSIIDIAHHMDIDEGLVSITALSLGTTLPELSVSITATRRGHAEIAIGNILGSCIFNALAVTGTAAVIAPIHITPLLREVALVFFLIASVFFYLLAQDKKISKWEGLLFLLFYVVFFLKIIKVI